MDKLPRKRIILYILIIILINVIMGCLLFKSRSFSHLAIWKIIESDKKDDFYWPPEAAPGYFRFEPNNEKLTGFRKEIYSVIKNEDNDFEIILEAARYVIDLSSKDNPQDLSLKWDSPESMLRQIKEGASANCFHRSILFSTYLSSLGIKSRLWALENENFNGVSHTVTEVYIGGLRKWVFIDVLLDFYVTDNGNPLSFLELRNKLLSGSAETILVHNIDGSIREMPFFYSRLTKCVFLRASNDFINKYNYRYGLLSILKKQLDKLPDGIRKGLEYLFGGRDIFIHYVDRVSESLKPKIIIAKLLFIFSLVSTGILLVMFSLSFLKRCP